MAKRKRRAFTPEFKAEAVRLTTVGDRTLVQVAHDLDLTESSLRGWVQRAEATSKPPEPGALSTAEREELVRLRRENKRLQMDRVNGSADPLRIDGQRRASSPVAYVVAA